MYYAIHYSVFQFEPLFFFFIIARDCYVKMDWKEVFVVLNYSS